MKDKLIILFLSILSLFTFSCNNATEPPPQEEKGLLTGKIVFSSDINGANNIYTVKPDGTELEQLTTISSSYPKWSPDGRQIAFVGPSPNSFFTSIYIMNADGSNIHLLPVQPQSLAMGQSPDWSPDGSKIVYNHIDGVNSYIVIVSLTDGKVLNLKNSNDTIQDYSPQWSPDGKKIAFISNRDYINDNRVLIDLYSMDSDGKNIKRLSEIGGAGVSYLWYPQDQSIVLSVLNDHLNGNKDNGKIFKIDTTGNIRTIYELSGFYGMAITNDGNHLVFSHLGLLTKLDFPNVANVRTLYLYTNNTIEFRFAPIEFSQDDETLLVISYSFDLSHSYLDLINIFAKDNDIRLKRITQNDRIKSADWHK